jgi:hypothetical protein
MMWPSLEQIPRLLETHVIKLVTALAILIVGWLVALIFSGITRMLLRGTRLDGVMTKIVFIEAPPRRFSFEAWLARGLFYFLMLFVFIAFFQALGLSVINEPLDHFLNQLVAYAPRLLGPLLLILCAWIIASALKVAVVRILGNASLQRFLSTRFGLESDFLRSVTTTLGNVIYWVVFLIFFLAVLDSLDLQHILEPLEQMLQKILSYVPNVLGALLILGVGWFFARVVQRIVSNLLASMGTDRLSEQVGLKTVLGRQSLAGFLGLVAYVVVLIPVLVASLNALKLDAITEPSILMLNKALTAVPSVFAAVLVLFTAWVVGQVIARLVTNLLTGAGFNTVLARLGVGKDPTDFNAILSKLGVGEEPAEGKKTFSEVAGYLLLVGIMLFASIEALDLVGFTALSSLLLQFANFCGQVILGVMIFSVGLFLGNTVAGAILASGSVHGRLLAALTRTSILVLAGAMALQQMGLARDIITLAFGLVLGAVALAVAIAFGIGGRDVAAQLLKEGLGTLRAKRSARDRV